MNDLQIIEEKEFSAAVDFAPCKCMLVSDDEEALLGLEDHWKETTEWGVGCFPFRAYFLEVVPCAIDKANSLGALLEVLDVKREEVIAMGDGVCDVTMIQLAGLGVAMGHSQDSVKICADYVTASNEEDGVAIAVEKAIIAEVRAAEIPLDQLNAQARHALMGNLGIQYTYADEDRVEATMPVDHRTRQPFRHSAWRSYSCIGGTVAGLGSMILCQPDEIVVGMQVSGNHISSAHEGDTVRAVGTVVHKGRSSHVWNVDVFTSTNKLVSSIRVVNSVMKKKMTDEEISNLTTIDAFIERKQPFAVYRIPGEKIPCLVTQEEGAVRLIYDLKELNGQRGFVIAPFRPNETCPILLIQSNGRGNLCRLQMMRAVARDIACVQRTYRLPVLRRNMPPVFVHL